MSRHLTASAWMTSGGRVTLPKAVRYALGLHDGDRLVFRVEASHVILARAADLLELAGTVPPPEQRGADWDEIRARTRRSRAAVP